MPHPLLIFSQSDYLIQVVDTNLHSLTNSADPDQLASSEANWLDLQCLQKQGISRFSRTRLIIWVHILPQTVSNYMLLIIFRYLEPDLQNLLFEEFEDSKFSKKFKKLNSSIAKMVSINKYVYKIGHDIPPGLLRQKIGSIAHPFFSSLKPKTPGELLRMPDVWHLSVIWYQHFACVVFSWLTMWPTVIITGINLPN